MPGAELDAARPGHGHGRQAGRQPQQDAGGRAREEVAKVTAGARVGEVHPGEAP